MHTTSVFWICGMHSARVASCVDVQREKHTKTAHTCVTYPYFVYESHVVLVVVVQCIQISIDVVCCGFVVQSNVFVVTQSNVSFGAIHRSSCLPVAKLRVNNDDDFAIVQSNTV